MTQFESYGDSAVRPELIHCRGDDKGSLSDDPSDFDGFTRTRAGAAGRRAECPAGGRGAEGGAVERCEVVVASAGNRQLREIVGDHEAWLLERIETPFTLRGLRVDYRTVWKAGVAVLTAW